MQEVDITIVGAGVVGLAIASQIATKKKIVLVIEKNNTFGQEISSRNSEVVHAGIYYPPPSLKAKTCVEGNRLLYELCERNSIPFKKLGKLIVATNQEDKRQLEALLKNALNNGLKDIRILTEKELKKLEPNIRGVASLFSPLTGIVDSHKLMSYLFQKAKEEGAIFAFGSEMVSLERSSNGYEVKIKEASEEDVSFYTRIFINSAGLNSDRVAQMAGIDIDKNNYNLKYCKGEYFRLKASKNGLVKRLIYPVPKSKSGGLGIHITPDLSGEIRLGPDDQYLDERVLDYSVDAKKANDFSLSVNAFAPFIAPQDLYPDMAGIRPKLQGEGEDFRDFVIKEEGENSFAGFINLIGIESPGLTSCLAIAKLVKEMIWRI